MRLSVKLTIENEKAFFGPGTYTLLKYVEEKGSLLTAAESMGLSYSKARKMIKNYKEQTGHDAIISQAGGIGGGSARITEHAKIFMNKYDILLDRTQELIQKNFKELYEEA
ncbi:winged helix-turn-helix domain-containing protein [Bullifex porci]|uniref:winged helix-turn-helix domain-containing protein n=1 Tax=Bullifex porci TaxID=2606638 RepID=UPI0023F1F08E|nr:hypothetical protein [Bullifex porci]MDD7256392.1 hypothetical protein [Bullifex porci]MDY2741251.1 hypothetical protein [Bullifex porci]